MTWNYISGLDSIVTEFYINTLDLERKITLKESPLPTIFLLLMIPPFYVSLNQYTKRIDKNACNYK